jgi:hypothetical protein
MARLRGSALIRTLAFLLLLEVCVDLGAHGLFASDHSPIATGCASSVGACSHDHCTTGCAGDHQCICHGLSVGSLKPATLDAQAAPGDALVPLSEAIPHSDRHPLDRPPRA